MQHIQNIEPFFFGSIILDFIMNPPFQPFPLSNIKSWFKRVYHDLYSIMDHPSHTFQNLCQKKTKVKANKNTCWEDPMKERHCGKLRSCDFEVFCWGVELVSKMFGSQIHFSHIIHVNIMPILSI